MFEFNTTTALTEDIIAFIRDLDPTNKRGNIFLDEVSEVAGSNSRVLISINRVSKSDNRFTISVMFTPIRRARLTKKVVNAESSLTRLLTSLSALQQECKFECRLTSQFRRRDKAIPIVTLPLKVTQFPGVAFSEIRGIHITSKDGESLVDAVLDTNSNDPMLQETVIFQHSQRFMQSLVEEIWTRGLELSKLFVVRG